LARRRAIVAVVMLILLAEGQGLGRQSPMPALSDAPCQERRLNEFLPNAQRDWNGDGVLDPGDDWIELHNAGSLPWDLKGWMLDDSDGPASSPPYVIPSGTVLAPGAYAVFYASVTGLDLHNTSDTVRLLAPDGSIVDLYTYYNAPRDRSYSLTEGCAWTLEFPPSPGRANGLARVFLPLVQRDAVW